MLGWNQVEKCLSTLGACWSWNILFNKSFYHINFESWQAGVQFKIMCDYAEDLCEEYKKEQLEVYKTYMIALSDLNSLERLL